MRLVHVDFPPERSGFYYVGVQKSCKSLLLERDLSHQPTPLVPAGIPSLLVRAPRCLSTPRPAAVPRAPPFGRYPGTSFFHLRLRSRSQAPNSAGSLPPALGSAWAQIRGRATGFLPRRLGPRVPAFSAGETLSRSPRAGSCCEAAGRRQRRRNPTAPAAPGLAAAPGPAASRQLR